MAQAGGFSLCDIPLREKIVYEGYMQMNKKYPSPYPAGAKPNEGKGANGATDLEKIDQGPSGILSSDSKLVNKQNQM
jgi:hypothetical protein